MDSEQSLLAAVIEDPDSMDQRMIAADWYEENSDPRAEFIRVQVALHQIPERHERRAELVSRECRLLAENSKRWNAAHYRQLNAGPLKNAFCSRRSDFRGWRYRRGFIEEVDVSADAWIQHGKVLRQLGPITGLKLRNVNAANVSRMINSECADNIQRMHLPAVDLRVSGIDHLLQELTRLPRLRILNLSGLQLDDAGVQSFIDWTPNVLLQKLVLSRGLWNEVPVMQDYWNTELLAHFGSLLRHENGQWWEPPRNSATASEPKFISYDDNFVYEDGRIYDEGGERDFKQLSDDDDETRSKDLAPWEEGDRNDDDEHWSDYVADDWVS